jgi:hypothetical protein
MNTTAPLTVPTIAGDKAVFACPNCEKSHTADVSKYKDIKTPIRLKAKCGCGHSFAVIIDKRDRIRKKTNLSGLYANISPGKNGQKGQMAVMDISRTGLKVKVSDIQVRVKDHDVYTSTAERASFGHKVQKKVGDLELGDKIAVKFNLDNPQKSLIQREAEVRWINKPYLGVQFLSVPMYDGALGFYLMN